MHNQDDDISKMLNIVESDSKRVVHDYGLSSSNTNQFMFSLTKQQLDMIKEAETRKKGIYPIIVDIPIEDLEKSDIDTWKVIPNSTSWNIMRFLSKRGLKCFTIQRKLPDSFVESERTAKNHDVVIINE